MFKKKNQFRIISFFEPEEGSTNVSNYPKGGYVATLYVLEGTTYVKATATCSWCVY